MRGNGKTLRQLKNSSNSSNSMEVNQKRSLEEEKCEQKDKEKMRKSAVVTRCLEEEYEPQTQEMSPLAFDNQDASQSFLPDSPASPPSCTQSEEAKQERKVVREGNVFLIIKTFHLTSN